MRKIENSVRVGKNAASLVVRRVTKAISEVMTEKYIVCPKQRVMFPLV